MNKEQEIEFYKELAMEIKPHGFRCFLYDNDTSAWLYIITPNNSWLYLDNGTYGGFDITYNYEPSRDFGSGCRCNEEALYEITVDTLARAEQYGKSYGHRGWVNVPNTYDGRTHRENVWRSPKHYEDAYKAMMNHRTADKLIELEDNDYQNFEENNLEEDHEIE